MIRFVVLIFVFFLNSLANNLNWNEIKEKIDQKYPNTPTLSISQLLKLQKNNIKFHLSDVRNSDEFKVSHLKNALFLPSFSDIQQSFPNKASRLVLYCSVGMRSAKLVKKLKKEGYHNVYNLEGSIFEWANQSLSVYQQNLIVHQVHPYNSYWGQLLNSSFHP